ncbi:hypothetical protein ES703_90680 [subsurface metagenome]
MKGCIMNEEKKCLSCGGTNLKPGSIQSSGKVAFRAKDTKFLTTKTGDITVSANICVDCGHIELIGDTDKASSLIGAS